MKKNWTETERFNLCNKLYGILGADIDDDEYDAIVDAIGIIFPAYGEALEKHHRAGERIAKASLFKTEIDKAGLGAPKKPEK